VVILSAQHKLHSITRSPSSKSGVYRLTLERFSKVFAAFAQGREKNLGVLVIVSS
jgi:hypothetical protein